MPYRRQTDRKTTTTDDTSYQRLDLNGRPDM